MSDQQKIWFIYLTDHHEGPFTAGEIAEKAKAGLVNGQSLAWKDGMPEWVPAETIPDLNAAMLSGAVSAEVAPAASSILTTETSEGELSLAQLLAAQQSGGENTSPTGQISDSASVLSSMLGKVQKDNPVTMGTGVSIGGFTPPTSVSGGEPGPDEDAWTLKIGPQVSGMHSLNRLKDLAGAGEIPADALVWHAGWSDFQPVSSIASIEMARKKGGGGRATNIKNSLPSKQGSMVSGMSNAAAAGEDEEPTDTEIEAPPKGLQGLLFNLQQVFKKKKKKAAVAKGKVAFAPMGTPVKKAGVAKAAPQNGSVAKRIATIFILLFLLGGGGGAAWFFLFSSPLPSDLDVNEEEKAAMSEVAKAKPESGLKLALAQARGTEDTPADPSSPKYYVATNLPEGSTVSLTVTGIPGTLVNRINFEKTFTSTVDKRRLAVFDQVKEDGKPLWGDFNLKAVAEGAEPAELKTKFIGSNRGAVYQARLKQYKDSVQAEYDKEIDELRQFITTLKAEQTEASRLIKEYKEQWATPASRTKIMADWASLNSKSQNFLGQVDQKLKERASGTNQPKFHARAFQDVSTTLGQIQQLVKAHSERLAGAFPTAGNPDELDGLAQAGVQALETWLSQAVAKSPFDASRASEPAKTPVATAAPTLEPTPVPPPPPASP